MRKIHLYGDLGEKYGKEHSFECSSLGEALRAINCAYEGFLSSIRRDGLYSIYNGSEIVKENELGLVDYKNKDFHITPIVAGAKDQKDQAIAFAVIGVALMASGYGIGVYAAGMAESGASMGFLIGAGKFATSVGIGMAIAGLTALIAPTPKDDGGVDDKSSFLFGSVQNVGEQGGPVPLAYGKTRTGSIIISTSLEAVDV